jgi:hypothetical protein
MCFRWEITVIVKVRFICTWALRQVKLSVSVAKGAFRGNIGFTERFSCFAPLAY